MSTDLPLFPEFASKIFTAKNRLRYVRHGPDEGEKIKNKNSCRKSFSDFPAHKRNNEEEGVTIHNGVLQFGT